QADYLSRYPERLAKITAADVQNAVRKHLHPERLTLVVVSQELDKEALKLRLEQNLLDPSTPLPNTIPIPKAYPQKPAEADEPVEIP
ncbi:insulinase family protein, partial [Acinetobacter nosocomialis]